MKTLVLYNSNLRHIDRNKYESQIILEKNITELSTIMNPNIHFMDDFNITIRINKDKYVKDINYIKLIIDNKNLYYIIDSINYSEQVKMWVINGSLDIWHTYITDFWKTDMLDRDQKLYFIQATVRKDIANKTDYLYNNIYMMHTPTDLELETIPVLNYIPDIIRVNIDKVPELTNNLYNFGLPITFGSDGGIERTLGLESFAYDPNSDNSVIIAIINTNKIAKVIGETPPPYVAILVDNYGGGYVSDELLRWLETDKQSNISFKTLTWRGLCNSIPKENVVNILKYPINKLYIDFREYIATNGSGFKELNVDILYPSVETVKINYFYVNTNLYNQENSYSFQTGSINNTLIKYLNYDTWKDFFNNFNILYHSSLLLYYSLDVYTFDTIYTQKMINIFSNNENDKPYFTFNLGTNGLEYIYNINYLPYIKRVRRYGDTTSRKSKPLIYNNNPYWLSLPPYKVHTGEIQMNMASTSNNWTQFEANNAWSASSGVALQKTLNWTNLGQNAGLGALGVALAGASPASMIAGGIALGGGIFSAIAKNKQIEGKLTDIKHSPTPLNSGTGMNYVYTNNDLLKITVNFLNQTNIDKANFYYKYFGNIVNNNLSLNEYYPDRNKETGCNMLKIANIELCFNNIISKRVQQYFIDNFKYGVRLWNSPIILKN